VLDLADVVGDLEAMLRRLIGEDVALVSVHEDGLGAVRADPGQIEQVILNLALNARDAMPRGGTVTVETANVVLDDGPHVLLAVSDTGEGMEAETLQHVFEPFFTTKEQGKGTGLGLATVYGIVEQSGGSIEVSSTPGRGTTFRIYLPRVDSAPEPAVLVPRRGAARGSETVLIVEDEPLVRELARRVLARHGYDVLEAADGAEALELCRGHAGRIDVLLSDVVMPGRSGPELAREVAQLRPDTKPLFMSGYTDAELEQYGVLAPGIAFMGKPFTPEGLALRVRDLIEERRAA
jgi:CheY-like chemotaxis protein